MIEHIVLYAVIPEQVSEENNAKYILSEVFGILTTVSNEQTQRVRVFF